MYYLLYLPYHLIIEIKLFLFLFLFLNDLANRNSFGFDGLSSEKHIDSLVFLLLSISFTGMFTNCYMPTSTSTCMLKSIIVSLVKNKCVYLADENNNCII